MSDNIIKSSNLYKSYHDGQTSINVLNGVDLTIRRGERIAIIGPSGSGKSTLLHLLGGLDKPTKGQITIQSTDWQSLSEKSRCKLRNQQLGFVYQFHHLLPEFSALENTAMPLLLAGMSVEIATEKSTAILEKVGLGARIQHKPSQLSGGERQRVAIARALVHQPQCVFADEPTGNLDQATAHTVFEHILTLNEALGTALVIVTHDKQLARRMDKIMQLQDGILVNL